MFCCACVKPVDSLSTNAATSVSKIYALEKRMLGYVTHSTRFKQNATESILLCP